MAKCSETRANLLGPTDWAWQGQRKTEQARQHFQKGTVQRVAGQTIACQLRGMLWSPMAAIRALAWKSRVDCTNHRWCRRSKKHQIYLLRYRLLHPTIRSYFAKETLHLCDDHKWQSNERKGPCQSTESSDEEEFSSTSARDILRCSLHLNWQRGFLQTSQILPDQRKYGEVVIQNR